MSDNPSSPLLGNIDNERSRPESCTSQKSSNSKRSNDSEDSKSSLGANRSVHSEESTPLLSRDIDYREYGDRPPPEDDQTSAAASSLKSIQDGPSQKGGRRWPTILALTLLCLVIITILVLGFVTPAVVQEYAKEAVIFEPTDLSIDSFTASGVKARVQGDFTLDASRVHKKPVRDLGRFGTWIVKAVESKRTKVKVYMPEYGDVLLGVADVPRIVVDVRNGHTTHVDFLSDLVAGDIDGIRRIASDWLDGRLGQLRVQGLADVELKSGIFNLGTQRISESVVFKSGHLQAL